MTSTATRIAHLRKRIQAAAARADRNVNEILLLAVSKTRDSSEIQQALAAEIHTFGENYLQEGLEKIAALEQTPAIWHFIGALQSNKTRLVANHFSWVHSVDRVKIAQRLSQHRNPHFAPLNICLQVNLDSEASKAGMQCDAVESAVNEIIDLPQIRLRGLMAIPAPNLDETVQRNAFERVRTLQATINRGLDNSQKLDTLSMGMSADLEAAILEGATILRVGTDIFGPRVSNNG